MPAEGSSFVLQYKYKRFFHQNMEEIKDIVQRIVRGCQQTGVEVSNVLAAFIAKTIVESNSAVFILDRKLTPERVEEIVLQSIEKLIEKDNPALETMKMQVDYDTSFLKHDTEAQQTSRARHKMLNTHKFAIVEVEMEDANDFEALTTLYRKIFRFLLEFAPNTKSMDRTMEREVAAALESVFPRIGLKAFLQLNKEEKGAQLMELAKIVLGIRLFNKDQGRGGVGIDNMDKECNELAMAMVLDVDREVDHFADVCAKYQKAIVRAHVKKRKQEYEDALIKETALRMKNNGGGSDAYDTMMMTIENRNSHGGAGAKDGGDAKSEMNFTKALTTSTSFGKDGDTLVSEFLLDRWSKELGNRRQYLGFLRALQEELHSLQEKISRIYENIRVELDNIKALVSNKSSVPKEMVYPRFDTLGTLWCALYEEVLVLTARSNTFRTLCDYRSTFYPTLVESFYADGTELDNATLADVVDSKEALSPTAESGSKGASQIASKSSKDREKGPKGRNRSKSKETISETSEAKDVEDGPEEKDSKEEEGSDQPPEEYTSDTGATLLSVHNTPDFMLLPLELQGYCPWSLVHAHGILIPGKPALGVVRYDNLYFVCDNEAAIHSFMERPDFYLQRIRDRAMRNPEYIHLLRMHRWFPRASISHLLDQTNEIDPRSIGIRAAKKDAATETPTHFIESYVDINYHWNEWELRRRALRIVNLKNCVTTSQQTDNSHFKRDNETQVYEPREKDTQTRREAGTNPPIVTHYIAGLRGKIEERSTEGAVSKYVDRPEKANKFSLPRVHEPQNLALSQMRAEMKQAPGSRGKSLSKSSSSPSLPPIANLDASLQRARLVTLTLDLNGSLH